MLYGGGYIVVMDGLVVWLFISGESKRGSSRDRLFDSFFGGGDSVCRLSDESFAIDAAEG